MCSNNISKERYDKLYKLCCNLLETAERGDYSNGITYQNMDEGVVRTQELLDIYRKELGTL